MTAWRTALIFAACVAALSPARADMRVQERGGGASDSSIWHRVFPSQSGNPGGNFRPAPLPPAPKGAAYSVEFRSTLKFVARAADGARVQFFIRRPPSHGNLTDLGPAQTGNGRIYLYEHTGTSAGADEIWFSTQAPGTVVSAPAKILLEILPPKPSLQVRPLELDFDPTVEGEASKRVLSLANSGSGAADVSFEIDAPWRIAESDLSFSLAPGGTREIPVHFLPTQRKKFLGVMKIRCEGQAPVGVALSGEGMSILAVAPQTLVLEPDFASRSRIGLLNIDNLTAEPQSVDLRCASLSSLPERISIGPRERFVLRISEPWPPVGEFEDILECVVGDWKTTVQIRALRLPGQIEVAPASGFAFDAGDAQGSTRSLEIKNIGGSDVEAVFESPDWLVFEGAESKVSLAPGEVLSLRFFLRREELPAKSVRDFFVIQIPMEQPIRIPVGCEISAPPGTEGASASGEEPAASDSAPTLLETGEPRTEGADFSSEMLVVLQVDTSTPGMATIQWDDPSSLPREYLVERRSIVAPLRPPMPGMREFMESKPGEEPGPGESDSGGNDEVKVEWHRVPDVSVSSERIPDSPGRRVTAVVPGIEGGRIHTLRVIPLSPRGVRGKLATQIQFNTPIVPENFPWWRSNLIFPWLPLGILAALSLYFLRRRFF